MWALLMDLATLKRGCISFVELLAVLATVLSLGACGVSSDGSDVRPSRIQIPNDWGINEGVELSQISAQWLSEPEFDNVTDVLLVEQDRVVVAEEGNELVRYYDGAEWSTLAALGVGPGELMEVDGLSLQPGQFTIFGVASDQRSMVFDTDGQLLGSYDVPRMFPRGVGFQEGIVTVMFTEGPDFLLTRYPDYTDVPNNGVFEPISLLNFKTSPTDHNTAISIGARLFLAANDRQIVVSNAIINYLARFESNGRLQSLVFFEDELYREVDFRGVSLTEGHIITGGIAISANDYVFISRRGIDPNGFSRIDVVDPDNQLLAPLLVRHHPTSISVFGGWLWSTDGSEL